MSHLNFTVFLEGSVCFSAEGRICWTMRCESGILISLVLKLCQIDADDQRKTLAPNLSFLLRLAEQEHNMWITAFIKTLLSLIAHFKYYR